jgi:hypothetical protein
MTGGVVTTRVPVAPLVGKLIETSYLASESLENVVDEALYCLAFRIQIEWIGCKLIQFSNVAFVLIERDI